ncbi:glutamate--cysteine ligase, putative [Richelia intracellularis HH01]|uniref:Glutamate--cysteine ligase, putative n=1 Tax=Richelia intracellularis HH01 TaxID=1165094 RepID=M1WZ35_9NOST|nr:glutamate--cysteine ligase, putative [Richelia intracellularis HH01]HAE06626.1 putative glutamate--cysteine ligase [Richelia sp.]
MLSKGFEVEMYTGTSRGDIIGLSDKITASLDGFIREPDSRNVEYITGPLYNYDQLLCGLVRPRLNLRQYLLQLGDYTLIPGSTLSLGGSDRFFRSDLTKKYHDYIEKNYGTKVVTASVHINIGINNPELLIQACRLIRMEAPLFLALSASSPFLDGKFTGYHSTRWYIFPNTPEEVPLFTSHTDHIQWVEKQLASGTMQNVRHLWTSVRPNGNHRPYNLNRLELRICDLVADPLALLAIMALLEARLLHLIDNPSLDPLSQKQFSITELSIISKQNEVAAAKSSLDAQLIHWQDGKTICARDWINELYEQVMPIAKQYGFSCFLSYLKKILQTGNEAQQWLQLQSVGISTRNVIFQAINNTREWEIELEEKCCPQLNT